jgi:Protein of unknown function (DUF4058)
VPLRDHFRAPFDNIASWEEFHGQWPAMLVLWLGRKLPPRYVAGPRVHLGAFVEVDIATHEKDDSDLGVVDSTNGNHGAVATAVWAPAKPTLSVATDLPALDEYEVRVYDVKRGRRLVAAIEIVSPSNKDRPEHRRAFVAKCAALLQNQISLVIIDLVTTRAFNLYSDLLDLIGESDPALGVEPTPTYAVACRATKPNESWQLDTWLHPLEVGQRLPTLPLWLAGNFSIALDLEESYEETCKALRIA